MSTAPTTTTLKTTSDQSVRYRTDGPYAARYDARRLTRLQSLQRQSRAAFVHGFGRVTPQERRHADLFYQALTGVPAARVTRAPEPYEAYAEQPAPPLQQRPYLPTGGRNFVPQQGVFNCAPTTPFVVIPASILPSLTANANAAIDTALTAAGLSQTQRGQIERAGLVPIATEFGGPALAELFARLRWSALDIVKWGRQADRMLVPRLLIHIPGHFRELARRAPDAREAFVLECLGWLLMAYLRTAVESATRRRWWTPPAPAFVTAVPNPVPPVSAEVRALLMRYLLIDTAMTADQWNAKLTAWGTGLPGRQWQAEVSAPQPGRPFYASLATIPAHVNTGTPRAAFAAAWPLRVREVDARHTPHAAGATVVTLAGLRNAVELRDCADNSPHLPAGIIAPLTLQGLELAYDFPGANRTVTRLRLMSHLHPVYTAIFAAIRELGWNDLLYQTGGGACFRGTKHDAAATVTIGGNRVTIDPFHQPDAAKVTQINTHFTPAQQAKVIAATRTARRLSEHGLGAAIDFNIHENDQGMATRPFGSMDPRIVSIFEAFHFRFGACFRPTDPMHFDYSQTPSAPVAAAAGTLGPVVTRRMLLPLQATGRVLV